MASLKSVLLNLVCVTTKNVWYHFVHIFIALNTVLVGDAIFMSRSNQPRILFPSSGSSNLTHELVLLLNGGPSCVNHSVSIVVSNALMLLYCNEFIQNITEGQQLPAVDLLILQNNTEVALDIMGNTNIEVNWCLN